MKSEKVCILRGYEYFKGFWVCKKKMPEGKSICKKMVSVIVCISALAWSLVCPYVIYDPGSPASNF